MADNNERPRGRRTTVMSAGAGAKSCPGSDACFCHSSPDSGLSGDDNEPIIEPHQCRLGRVIAPVRRRGSSQQASGDKTDLALQAGTVRQQLLDGDRAIVETGGLELEPRQMLLHRIIESDLACLAQLHDRDGREEFRV